MTLVYLELNDLWATVHEHVLDKHSTTEQLTVQSNSWFSNSCRFTVMDCGLNAHYID